MTKLPTGFLKLRFILLSIFTSVLLPLSSSALTINGAGSTFAEPLYTKWTSDFQKKEKDLQFNYQGVGSGAGIKQLLEGTVDFAGSDDPIKASDEAKVKSGVLHLPIAAGAVVVSYNLEVSKTLKLSGPVIAKMFNGKITKWNDVEIAALNPGVKIPDKAIAVATRSDGSGTTAVFSEFLSKVSPDWAGKNGKTVNWFPGSLGAKGNAGVAGLIKQNPGTVGYVELVYAVENKLAYATIQNKTGEFIEATVKSVTAAATGRSKEALANNFKLSLTDSPNKGAYPISAFTWMLIKQEMPKDKGPSIIKFAKWILTEDAQKTAGALSYAPVPNDIRVDALKALDKVKVN